MGFSYYHHSLTPGFGSSQLFFALKGKLPQQSEQQSELNISHTQLYVEMELNIQYLKIIGMDRNQIGSSLCSFTYFLLCYKRIQPTAHHIFSSILFSVFGKALISHCCIPIQLIAVLREVKYLNFQQQKEIPDSAGSLFSQNETLQKFVDNLDLIVGWYNKVFIYQLPDCKSHSFNQKQRSVWLTIKWR